jgi:hypothetical protein
VTKPLTLGAGEPAIRRAAGPLRPRPAGMPPRLSLSPTDPRRRTLLRTCVLALALTGLGFAPGAVRADVIPVKSAELRIEDGEVLLNAEFEFAFNPTLEEALSKGVPLYIEVEFELTRPRWYWLDEKVAQAVTVYRVSFAPLTRQYRVASGLLAQTFATLEEVERFVGRVTSRPVARAADLAKGARYDAAVRLRLDVNQLPKPLQVSALASREWQLASEWQRWSFTP